MPYKLLLFSANENKLLKIAVSMKLLEVDFFHKSKLYKLSIF